MNGSDSLTLVAMIIKLSSSNWDLFLSQSLIENGKALNFLF